MYGHPFASRTASIAYGAPSPFGAGWPVANQENVVMNQYHHYQQKAAGTPTRHSGTPQRHPDPIARSKSAIVHARGAASPVLQPQAQFQPQPNSRRSSLLSSRRISVGQEGLRRTSISYHAPMPGSQQKDAPAIVLQAQKQSNASRVISKGNAARQRINNASAEDKQPIQQENKKRTIAAGGRKKTLAGKSVEKKNIANNTKNTKKESPAAKNVSKRGVVSKKRGGQQATSSRSLLSGKRNMSNVASGNANKEGASSTPKATASTKKKVTISPENSLQREFDRLKRELERERKSNQQREKEIEKARAENAGLKKELRIRGGDGKKKKGGRGRGPVKSRLSLGENEHGFREINPNEITMGDRLGKGGYGEVYRAQWQGNQVAVKVFTEDVCQESIEEFKCEAKILSRLRHPNIVLFMGACTDPSKGLMMMTELLGGGSLFDRLHRHRERWGQMDPITIKIITDVARALNYLHLHEPQIIHRDLKSSNILLDVYGNAKICDFGTARRHTGREGVMTGEIGTANWTAPEILRNDKYDEKCDVFSMGMVIWEILHGEMPWTGMSAIQIATTVVTKPGTRLPISYEISQPWSDLIQWCWNEDPTERPSFQQILDYLQANFPPVE